MFTKSFLERILEESASVPHETRVRTPLSFSIRPIGLSEEQPGYSVLVERSAFRMRAQVVVDALGNRIRTAILAGIESNPAATTRTNAVVREHGWRPEIRVADYDIFIGAFLDAQPSEASEEFLASCVHVACALSDLILAQLVVTRSLETRPAAIRQASDQLGTSPVWEYDPSERDRSTLQHRLLENWLIAQVQDAGLQPLDAVRGPLFDLAWHLGNMLVLCEVKSTRLNETMQLRLGVGQLLHYRAAALATGVEFIQAALLVDGPPVDPIWQTLCNELDIVLFWPEDGPLPERLRRDS